MSNQGNSTTASALPSRVGFEITREELTALDMEGLDIVYDALFAANASLLGVLNQPRSSGRAGNFVGDMMSKLDFVTELVIEVARSARPTSRTEASNRAYLLMKYAASMNDDFEQLSTVFESLLADLARG